MCKKLNSGHFLVCYMCDSFGENNCFDTTCIGTACIKRLALVDGIIRVQKMCQQTSEPFLDHCERSVLWKDGIGTECVCQKDYCNNTSKSHRNNLLTALIFIINYLI
ncbi:unnamed protein product [Thelazia callipaeda]|uniref:Protein quiver n=1 Tax=Thelazia callipaeda TaxID=103827 RepID=A0A0N5CTC5_THECL|nr:unnamed protein product [Thelazia callipaeda]